MENRKTYNVEHEELGRFTLHVIMQHDTWISGNISGVANTKPFIDRKHPVAGFYSFNKAKLKNLGEVPAPGPAQGS